MGNTEANKTMSSVRVPCHYPWSSIYVSPNGDVRHCCSTNLKRLGNLGEQSIEEIWNGPMYQLVRHHVGRGEYAEAFCNPNCEGLRNRKGYPWPELTHGFDGMEVNELRARSSFEDGASTLDSLPTQLKIEFTDICNFRCVMCFYDFIPPYNTVPEEALEQIREISRFATHVTLMGGEVFMNKHDLNFLRDFAPAEGASMGFVTNASYLDDKIIAMLGKFKRIGMQISIDGTTKEVFEKIRVRGNWEVVDGNIRRVLAAARELAARGYEWNVSLACVVMKSNLANLAHSVAYAADLGVPIAFNPVKGFYLFDENIFVYRNLLDDMPDWRRHIKEAFETLEESRATYAHYGSVRQHLEQIERYLESPKITLRPGVINLMRKFVRNEKDIGHAVGLYFDWRVEGVGMRATLSYLGRKLWGRLKAARQRTKSERARRGAGPPATPLQSGPELVKLGRGREGGRDRSEEPAGLIQ